MQENDPRCDAWEECAGMICTESATPPCVARALMVMTTANANSAWYGYAKEGAAAGTFPVGMQEGFEMEWQFPTSSQSDATMHKLQTGGDGSYSRCGATCLYDESLCDPVDATANASLGKCGMQPDDERCALWPACGGLVCDDTFDPPCFARASMVLNKQNANSDWYGYAKKPSTRVLGVVSYGTEMAAEWVATDASTAANAPAYSWTSLPSTISGQSPQYAEEVNHMSAFFGPSNGQPMQLVIGTQIPSDDRWLLERHQNSGVRTGASMHSALAGKRDDTGGGVFWLAGIEYSTWVPLMDSNPSSASGGSKLVSPESILTMDVRFDPMGGIPKVVAGL